MKIKVNYDEKNAIQKIIDKNKFDYKYLGIDVKNIPLVYKVKKEVEVKEIHFNKIMYNQDLLKQVKFVDPLTALTYAYKNPNIQKKYPLVILFNDNQGQLWCLYLGEDGGGRSLGVYRNDPVGLWGGFVRFLAFCELPLETKTLNSKALGLLDEIENKIKELRGIL